MLRALITNIQILAKSSSPKKTIRKEPYFDKKWGKDTAFEKTVDRSNYDPIDTQDSAAQIHDQILVMYKTASKKLDTGRNSFLTKLAGDSIEFIEEQRDRMQKARQE